MWRGLMEAAHAAPSVLALAGDAERLAALEEANLLLEQIQKVWVCVCACLGVSLWRDARGEGDMD
jgi:hypothetical protein